VRTVTCSGLRPVASAATAATSCWACVGPQTRHESARTSAVKFIGSMGAWARNGSSYVASSFRAAVWSAVSTSPCLRITAAGPDAAASSAVETAPESSARPGPSSQRTTRASRATFACHQVSATTATPSVIRTTCRTPGIALALASSRSATFPPITGHCASDA
jgi:hypothetical protein